MIKLRDIIDTWNVIEKYDITWSGIDADGAVLVQESEFQRLLSSVKNKRYILNLKKA